MSFIKSVIRLINAFGKKLDADHVAAYAAQAAFFIILSFFPFAMFLLTLLQFLPFSQTELITLVVQISPDYISEFLTPLIQEIYLNASPTLLSITVIAAIWAASKGFLSLSRGLNSVYNIHETRNYILLRIRAMIYTLIFALLLILLLALFVFGNQIALWISGHFPAIDKFALVIISARTVAGMAILMLFFLILYKFIPNRKTRLLHELPGAVLSAAGWVGFSFLYSFYIDNMSNMSATYGSLTAIVLLMLWLYACMFILFLGAELNDVLENPVVHSNALKLFSRKKRD